MPDGTINTGIGASVKRVEDQRFLTGKGNYTDDINRPDQTYAYMLRSPHAHAKIISIESSNAQSSEGVVAIFEEVDQRRPSALRINIFQFSQAPASLDTWSAQARTRFFCVCWAQEVDLAHL